MISRVGVGTWLARMLFLELSLFSDTDDEEGLSGSGGPAGVPCTSFATTVMNY